jgi:hypothetical protein
VREAERWVVAEFVAEVDMWRITLTPVVLNAAAEVVFLLAGADKAAMLHRVLDGPVRPEALPAQIVAPSHGRLRWLVDAEAALDWRTAEMRRVVFLFDVDNTLVDNDRIAADLRRYLTKEVGEGRQQEYWEIFEQLRAELGYADYLGALQRYRVKHPARAASPGGLVLPRELSVREPALSRRARRARPRPLLRPARHPLGR